MTIEHQALARDLARRQQLASHDELRVIDRVLLELERRRDHRGQFDGPLDALIDTVIGELAAEDAERAELREAARREMLEFAAPDETRCSVVPGLIARSDADRAKPVNLDSGEPYVTIEVETR